MRPVYPDPLLMQLHATGGGRVPDPTCRHCSRPYSEHTDEPGRMVPRTECRGMRERFEVRK